MDHNKIAVEIFDKYAEQYADKYMDVSLYAFDLNLLCGLLPPDAAVLELACGPGNVTSYILEKRPDLKVLATDLSPNMISVAQRKVPNADFGLLDCRELGSLEKSFDAVVFAFGIPYLSPEEVQAFITNSRTILNPGGLLYISFMAGSNSDSGWHTGSQGDKIYLYYHDDSALKTLLVSNGFEIAGFRNIPSLMNGMPVNDVVIIARFRN